jgi:hypothetical protein
MVETKLVESKIEDGETLLRELDRQKFPVEAMFWISRPETNWRLIIGSTVVTEQGTRAGYHRLGEIYDKLDLLGLALEDITLLDPHEKPFLSLRSEASRSSRLAAAKYWIQYDEAVVYRWDDRLAQADITCNVTLDELHRFWNDERKLSNQPLLLLDLDGRRLTLRFHPQHRNSAGIQEIKQAFQIALHRGRPDCNLNWIG